jgi:hypothetical protein
VRSYFENVKNLPDEFSKDIDKLNQSIKQNGICHHKPNAYYNLFTTRLFSLKASIL